MIGQVCRDKVSVKLQQREQQNWQEKEINQQQWLLFGVQSGFEKNQICTPMKKESYKKTLLQQYKSVETVYEKVLILKAIGNAGLDNMINEIERIVNGGVEQQVVIRAVAIDSLRRLRNQLPRQIQRICLPVFQNQQENVELRMAAVAIMMSTELEQPIIDQIVYTIANERSNEVKGFTYNLMARLAESKIEQQQQM